MGVTLRDKGFYAGALGGLALALLVVGAGALGPQPSDQVITSAHPPAVLGAAGSVGSSMANTSESSGGSGSTTTISTPNASSPTSVASAQSSPSSAPYVGNFASSATPKKSTMTTSSPASQSSSSGSSVAVAPGQQPQGVVGTQPALSTAPHRPDSLLAAIPGEGVSTLLGTLSPLIVGLLVAALVYGAYSRRQDS
jgi:hypothetical protein